MPYPNHLKENMPIICPKSWLVNHIREKYGLFGRYLRGEEDALNRGIGCNNSVIISSCTVLILKCKFEL